MTRSLVLMALFCLSVLSMADVSMADMAMPGRRPRPWRYDRPAGPPQPAISTVPFLVRIDVTGRDESCLELPQRLLQRVQNINKTGDRRPRIQTIAAGMAMSFAIAGAFFLRRTKAGQRALVSMILCGGMSASMGLAVADIAVPSRYRLPAPPSPANPAEVLATFSAPANLNVKIQIVPGPDQVTLVLSQKDAARAGLSGQPNAAPAPSPLNAPTN